MSCLTPTVMKKLVVDLKNSDYFGELRSFQYDFFDDVNIQTTDLCMRNTDSDAIQWQVSLIFLKAT